MPLDSAGLKSAIQEALEDLSKTPEPGEDGETPEYEPDMEAIPRIITDYLMMAAIAGASPAPEPTRLAVFNAVKGELTPEAQADDLSSAINAAVPAGGDVIALDALVLAAASEVTVGQPPAVALSVENTDTYETAATEISNKIHAAVGTWTAIPMAGGPPVFWL